MTAQEREEFATLVDLKSCTPQGTSFEGKVGSFKPWSTRLWRSD
jgi:hypothetical protein